MDVAPNFLTFPRRISLKKSTSRGYTLVGTLGRGFVTECVFEWRSFESRARRTNSSRNVARRAAIPILDMTETKVGEISLVAPLCRRRPLLHCTYEKKKNICIKKKKRWHGRNIALLVPTYDPINLVRSAEKSFIFHTADRVLLHRRN